MKVCFRGGRMVATLCLVAAVDGAAAQDLEKGRKIYREGPDDGSVPTIFAGDRVGRVSVLLPPCANCHGRDARGGGEGAVKAPPINREILLKETSRRPAYDLARFLLAMRDGRDPGNAALSRLMPRYALSDAELAAVFGYLGEVGAEQRRGIQADQIKLALAVPHGLRTTGESLVRAFEQGWKALGEAQPHGRRVQVEVVEARSGERQWSNLAALDAAALILSVPDPNRQLFSVAARLGLPVILPLAQADGMESPLDLRTAFASLRDEIAHLVEAAGERAVFVTDEAGREQLRSLGFAHRRPILSIPEWQASEPRSDRVLLMVQTPAGSRDFLACDLEGVTVFRPSALGRRVTGALLRKRAAIPKVATPFDPTRWQAADLGADRLAGMTAVLLHEVLILAGRDLTNQALVRAMDEVVLRQPQWPELDYRRHPLTGTRDVGIIPD